MALPEEIVAGIDRLDPLPATCQRQLTLAQDEDSEIGEIVGVLEQDEAVASNLLRTVNSSAFAGHTRIDDLQSAVVRLGLNTVLEITVGGHLRGLSVDARMYDLNEDDLWRHSAAASIAAGLIRRQSPADVPPSASLAALVHDVGKLVMVRHLDADVQGLLELCDAHGLSFVEAERRRYGFDHAEVGAAIGRVWNFPEEVTGAIAGHHESPFENPTPLLDTVALANFVCKTIGVGLGAAGMHLKIDTGVLERLGLGYEGFCEICGETSGRVHELD